MFHYRSVRYRNPLPEFQDTGRIVDLRAYLVMARKRLRYYTVAPLLLKVEWLRSKLDHLFQSTFESLPPIEEFREFDTYMDFVEYLLKVNENLLPLQLNQPNMLPTADSTAVVRMKRSSESFNGDSDSAYEEMPEHDKGAMSRSDIINLMTLSEGLRKCGWKLYDHINGHGRKKPVGNEIFKCLLFLANYDDREKTKEIRSHFLMNLHQGKMLQLSDIYQLLERPHSGLKKSKGAK